MRRVGWAARNAARWGGPAILLMGTLEGFAQTPLALVPVDAAKDGGVKVAGAIEVSNGHAIIGSSGSITAGDKTASIFLPGKGELRLCSTTTVHLSRDRSAVAAAAPGNGGAVAGVAGSGGAPVATAVAPAAGADSGRSGSGALMMALDRGALEASFATGKYSDVLMTPDFRILISGPGQADLRIRVSEKGDTCIENRGEHAPYVTVSSQLEDGLYRIQPNQRVLFEHGSLREVVDHEADPCGCPPDVLVAGAATGGAAGAAAGKGPAFPLAESEGLAPIPQPTAQAAVPVGETQTQVTVPLAYNGVAAPVAPAPLPAAGAEAAVGSAAPPVSGAGKAAGASAAQTASSEPSSPVATAGRSTQSGAVAGVGPELAAPAPKPTASNGVFHRIGRFFSRLFGR